MNFHAPHQPATWSTLSVTQRRIAVSALVATGTAQEAAIQLGTTKSAIIGFCSRHSIELGNWTLLTRKVQPSLLPARTWAASGCDVGLLPREEHQCAWPTTGDGSGQQYCGLPIKRGSFCAAHAAQGYAPRAADSRFVEEIRKGRILSGKEPEITIKEALAVVRPKPKMEGAE